MKDFNEILKEKILPQYLEDISKIIIEEEVSIYPDRFVRTLTIDGTKYCLLYADYLDEDLDYNTKIIKSVGLEVKRFVSLKNKHDKYVCVISNKKTPYTYEPILDNCYLLAKVL